MYSRHQPDLQNVATQGDHGLSADSELGILRDVFRMLPSGVTVQDEQGRFLLVNDAAAVQLGIAAGEPAMSLSKEFHHRRETGLELLRAGRAAVAEECVGPAKQVFLTAHRPVRIADRNLLLSSSADISEQKAVEDHLFRSAYYDELTGLPTRRVIEHRANSLLQREAHGRFALAFLDIDNFQHINDYYGHSIGDALLVELAKRLGLDLRESDMLSRISGDEFLLCSIRSRASMKWRIISTLRWNG
jgi:cyclic di-GMP phosphodiesterase Gmr